MLSLGWGRLESSNMETLWVCSLRDGHVFGAWAGLCSCEISEVLELG